LIVVRTFALARQRQTTGRIGGPQTSPRLSTRSKLSLLPNRPVVMDSLTLKEAVMHHAESKQQNQDNKESYESDL
jgi:ABC-type multidrug transport system ATPase subunit